MQFFYTITFHLELNFLLQHLSSLFFTITLRTVTKRFHFMHCSGFYHIIKAYIRIRGVRTRWAIAHQLFSLPFLEKEPLATHFLLPEGTILGLAHLFWRTSYALAYFCTSCSARKKVQFQFPTCDFPHFLSSFSQRKSHYNNYVYVSFDLYKMVEVVRLSSLKTDRI